MKATIPFFKSVRLFLSIIAFFGLGIQYSQRIDLKVLIDCMVNRTALEVHTNWFEHVHDTSLMFNRSKQAFRNNQSSNACGYKNHVINRSHLDGPFVWSKTEQRLILAAYSVGYTISQIPGGYLSLVLGAKRVICIAYLFSSILTILIPVFANLNEIWIIICRFFIGMFHGLIWPTFAGFWNSWVPIAEHGRLIGLAYAGSQIGNASVFALICAITLPLGSSLCKNGYDGKWPIVFFIIGLLGLIWLVVWLLLASDTPEQNGYIGKAEKDYLISELPDQFSTYEGYKIPWKSIITSKPCVSLFIGHTCSKFGSYILVESFPLFVREILEIDDSSTNNLLFAMPYLCYWFFTILSGVISDKLVVLSAKTHQKRTNIRKIFHTLAFFMPMIAVFSLIFVTCALRTLALSLIAVCLAFTGCAYGAGLFVAYNDVSGPFAGVTFGIGNTFGSMSGILAPFVVEFMHKNKKQEEWYTEYILIAIMYLIGGLVLLMFSSSEEQSWAIKKPRNPKKTKRHVYEQEICNF